MHQLAVLFGLSRPPPTSDAGSRRHDERSRSVDRRLDRMEAAANRIGHKISLLREELQQELDVTRKAAGG